MSELTKIGRWYMGTIEPWQTKLYGFSMRNGVGDLISNNMDWIRKTKDRSQWACDCLVECFDLLLMRQRWPDEFQNETDQPVENTIPHWRQCKTRLCSWLNKMKFNRKKKANERREKKGKPKKDFTVKYRSQGDMTRDPYIHTFATAVDMGLFQFLPTVSIPWYLYRGATWKWHKFLKKPTDRRYKRWQRAERRASWFRVEDFADKLQQARLESGKIMYTYILTNGEGAAFGEEKLKELISFITQQDKQSRL